jgi:uncharacterized protein (TIGR02246 family)
MDMKRWLALLVAAGLCAPLAPAGEQKKVPSEDPAHQELRALKQQLLDAFNKKDVEALLKHVHPNVVVTWQNGEVSRGHDGIRAYYKKMLEGPDRKVKDVTAKAEVDELTILNDAKDNGLAFGTLDQDFTLTDGSAFHLKSRWTAQVAKHEGQWKVSGLHVSADIFDNGVLHLAVQRTALWTAIMAGLIGLILGILLSWVVRGFLGKKPAAGTTP